MDWIALLLCCSVGSDELWLHLDTADTLAVDDGELDVALVAPGGVPGVLNEPVFLTVLGAPADGEHGVVKSGAALGAVEDTALVGLEDVLVGLDGDGERLLGEGGLHLGDVVGGDEAVAAHVDGGGGALVVGARWHASGTRDVRVGGLSLGLGGLPVFEGLVLPATVATVVGSGA